jgi:hypothetical protein
VDSADAIDQIESALVAAVSAIEAEGAGGAPYSRAITVCASTIARLTATGSVYERQMKRVLDRGGMMMEFYVNQLVGVLEGLKMDIEAGYLLSFEEELHAGVFADFLEMADHLIAEKYALPAAVVAGAALEAHLRSLAERNNVKTVARGKPKRAAALNDDLAKSQVYGKAEHKQVLAWQALRNSAAHGDEDFTASEIRLMTQGIRDFLVRHPA